MKTLQSVGKCVFCNKEFSKSGISRHLNGHLAKNPMNKKAGKSFHIKVEVTPRWGSGPYFLNLLINGNTTFEELDDFLRDIWLECCGHLSAFRNPKQSRRGFWGMEDPYELLEQGKIKEYEAIMEANSGEVPKSRKTKDVFVKGLKLEYEYDFGSTTQLQVAVLEEFPFTSGYIEILSRNEPLPIMCDVCHTRSAVYICTVCSGYADEAAFCNPCAKKHEKECSDFEEYAKIPVVNSPRMGVCAYTGGRIDKERDGIYQP